MSSDMECRIVRSSRGPVRIRVQKDADPETVERIVEAAAQKVAEIVERQCRHIGPHPMPEIAQKIHGRETYWCGLDKGHEGPHSWSGLNWPEQHTAPRRISGDP